ncbi:MAG: UDP-3-O-acyl-N-acetylglucosamine deacetylase [candidate division WS1 bacterium]|nr:UDP-3-O-acyl-N-acetylglucosamine deacetylase [candidate division WS1 bacterium]
MLKRQTLRQSFSLTAEGVRSGRQIAVTVEPAPSGSGLVLIAMETGDTWPLDLSHTLALPGCTAAGTSQRNATYIEHFLAACSGVGLTDAYLRVQGPELPLLDGSALPWLEAFQSAGLKTYPEDLDPLVVTEMVMVMGAEASLAAVPASAATLAYLLDHPHPLIGRQAAAYRPGTDEFARLVAPARTFTTIEEATLAREQGLMLGGSEENAILVYPDRLSAEPAIPQAFAFHKLLDLTGDLYVLGRPVQAGILGRNSGHRLNHLFAQALQRHADTTEAVFMEAS